MFAHDSVEQPVADSGVKEYEDILKSGKVYMASTNKGHKVHVWVPPPNGEKAQKYFCHGDALGTFVNFGYSVFSEDVSTVLQDEHVPLAQHQFSCGPFLSSEEAALQTCLDGAELNGVIAWHDSNGMVGHSARIVTLPPKGQRTLDQVMVVSKNGLLDPPRIGSIRQVSDLYASKLKLTKISFWSPSTLSWKEYFSSWGSLLSN